MVREELLRYRWLLVGGSEPSPLESTVSLTYYSTCSPITRRTV